MSNGYWQKRAALEWQLESGVIDALEEAPLNRYDVLLGEGEASGGRAPLETQSARLPESEPKPAPAPPAFAPSAADPVAVAESLAGRAKTLEELATAQAAYDFCDIKKGARNFVFADGIAKARVMIIGEAPGRDEDIQAKPFVGQAGQLLDVMFDAIGMGRNSDEAPIYITNVLPWRPPQNRTPKTDEIAMMVPFIHRHIALIDPDILVLMGNVSCQALLGRQAITRIRGTWFDALGKRALPMLHPAYLLRNPIAKAQSWQDLLRLKDALEAG